ncbi:hypothetical protein Tco_1010947, partial [Tanacetum coccineum]
MIYVDKLKMDSENDNEKVNMPLLPSPEPMVSYFDDLDFFKDFEKEFPAIVYNDSQTSKLYFLTEPTLSPQHIDEFNLKDETSLSECDEEEQNVLNFNDLFPFNVIYLNDSKSDKDNDDDKINIEHSSKDLSVKPLPAVINTDVGAYAHGSNKLLETKLVLLSQQLVLLEENSSYCSRLQLPVLNQSVNTARITAVGEKVNAAESLLVVSTEEIRIKQYFQIQDYALWEVIENGNSWVPIPVTTPPESGTSTTTKMTVPTTIEEKTCKKNDVKARSLLLMALPNEYQ